MEETPPQKVTKKVKNATATEGRKKGRAVKRKAVEEITISDDSDDDFVNGPIPTATKMYKHGPIETIKPKIEVGRIIFLNELYVLFLLRINNKAFLPDGREK